VNTLEAPAESDAEAPADSSAETSRCHHYSPPAMGANQTSQRHYGHEPERPLTVQSADQQIGLNREDHHDNERAYEALGNNSAYADERAERRPVPVLDGDRR
jgi:hypothetical protein